MILFYLSCVNKPLIDWLIDWVIDRLIDWSIDWLIDWLIYLFIVVGGSTQREQPANAMLAVAVSPWEAAHQG